MAGVEVLVVLDAVVLAFAGLLFALGLLVRAFTYLFVDVLHVPRRIALVRATRALRRDFRAMTKSGSGPGSGPKSIHTDRTPGVQEEG